MTIQDTVLTELAPQPYAAIRDRIRDGDVPVCSANDFGSRIIRWATRTHGAIAPSPSGCARRSGTGARLRAADGRARGVAE